MSMRIPEGCGPFADAILAGAARTVDLDDHLAACPACRQLAAAHRAAARLARVEVSIPPAVGMGEVLARVRRRRALRVAGGAVAAGAMVVAFLTGTPSRSPVGSGPAPDLFALADGVARELSRDPLQGDPALRSLGTVSDWLAPPRGRSLGLDSIASPPGGAVAGGLMP